MACGNKSYGPHPLMAVRTGGAYERKRGAVYVLGWPSTLIANTLFTPVPEGRVNTTVV